MHMHPHNIHIHTNLLIKFITFLKRKERRKNKMTLSQMQLQPDPLRARSSTGVNLGVHNSDYKVLESPLVALAKHAQLCGVCWLSLETHVSAIISEAVCFGGTPHHASSFGWSRLCFCLERELEGGHKHFHQLVGAQKRSLSRGLGGYQTLTGFYSTPPFLI